MNYVYFKGSQDAAHDFGTLRKYKVMWVYYYGILLLNNFVLRLIMCLHWFQVTHILNVAYGVENVFPDLFIYKTLSILDLPDTDIISHIEECARFIDQAKAEVTFAFCFMVNSWLHLVNILWFPRMFLHKSWILHKRMEAWQHYKRNISFSQCNFLSVGL